MNILPVRDSPDLQRILQLPRRAQLTESHWEQLARAWTLTLLNETGRRELARVEALPDAERQRALKHYAQENRPLTLSALQGQMLSEALQMNGLFASAAVGAGKTLVSWLLALVFGAVRPAVLVPGSLERDTHDKFAAISTFWRAPSPSPYVLTYEFLQQPENAAALCGCVECTRALEASTDGLCPDLLVCDESDLIRKQANKKQNSARLVRVHRYAINHHDRCRFMFLTGTPLRKSIQNFAPQLVMALKENAPVPFAYTSMQEWCEAIDERTRGPKRPPGALLQLAAQPVPKGKELIAARHGFRDRLLSTPGIVVSSEQSCTEDLIVRFIAPPEEPKLDEAFYNFRLTQQTLDGWDVDDPLSALRYGTELSCNFYSKWDPRPPAEWLEARREAAIFVRETIARSQRSGQPLDTMAQVYRKWGKDTPALLRWKEIEPTFVPNSVPVPVGLSVLGAAAKWLLENTPALVFTQHRYVGHALSKMTGVPYFGPKGLDEHGRYIMKHSPKQSAILSLHANRRGRNLQAWNNALIVGPSPTATDWEQGYAGRMHRQGQHRPVTLTVLLSSAESVTAIEKAIAEAQWCEQTGGHKQKLLIAQYDWSQFPAHLLHLPLQHPARSRWARVTNNYATTTTI